MWSLLEPIEAALSFIQLGLECLNIENTWCAIHQQAIQNYSASFAALPNGGNCNTFPNATSCGTAARGCRWNANNNDCEDDYTGQQGLTKLTLFCHPCTGAYLWRMIGIINLQDQLALPDNSSNPRDQVRTQLLATLIVKQGICTTDLKNNFCMPQLQSVNANFANPCTGLAAVVGSVGCCAASIISFEMGVCQLSILLGQNTTCVAQIQQFQGVLQSCSTASPPVVLGPTCAEIKFAILVKLIVSGIDPLWWAVAANHNLLLALIQKIAAYNAGLNATAVTVTSGGTGRRLLAGNSVPVTATITVQSADEYTSAQSGLSATANLETLDLNGNVPSSGVSPVQLTSSGVNPPTPATSSATATKTAFAFAIALVAALA